MCYSAQIWADYRLYVRQYGAELDIKATLIKPLLLTNSADGSAVS